MHNAPNPTPRSDAERRITGRVVAHPLTGQPEPWLEVEGFECAADEFPAQMRAVADSWSTRRAGDVLAFRVRPRVGGVGSFYWYLSHSRGPVPIPAATGDDFGRSVDPVGDWLSEWSRAADAGTLVGALAMVDWVLSSKTLQGMFDRAVKAAAKNRLIRAEPERNRATILWFANPQRPLRLTVGRNYPVRAVEMLARALSEAEKPEVFGWEDPTDPRGFGLRPREDHIALWRGDTLQNVVRAIVSSAAMLSLSAVDKPLNLRSPKQRAAYDAAMAELVAWVRQRVSLDDIARLLEKRERASRALESLREREIDEARAVYLRERKQAAERR